ncbi:hypothetical protein LEP1GSC100_4278 [Leptospira interrogans serovar Bataviae str. UI 08561]|nr:hypothetical protein LEP1GSC100_4278 [Leptospira interrogans serovar Bataviae str. UI 08561]
MSEGFADECLRGLRNEDHRGKNDRSVVTANAFIPPPADVQKNSRFSSINHYDNEEALNILKADEQNSRFGIAKFSVSDFDSLRKLSKLADKWFLNRDPINKKDLKNPFHGNIIYLTDLSQERIKSLAGALASVSSIIE